MSTDHRGIVEAPDKGFLVTRVLTDVRACRVGSFRRECSQGEDDYCMSVIVSFEIWESETVTV